MHVARRLFVVPLANDKHGKGTMLNALIEQGQGQTSSGRKGPKSLTSPFGREIDSYIFLRSFQEHEKNQHGTVEAALDANDPDWRKRELIIFSSHVAQSDLSDVQEMIDCAHSGGFDPICASVILHPNNRHAYSDFWRLRWSERWTIPNDFQEEERQQEAQCRALGHDLWTWICRALAS